MLQLVLIPLLYIGVVLAVFILGVGLWPALFLSCFYVLLAKGMQAFERWLDRIRDGYVEDK